MTLLVSSLVDEVGETWRSYTSMQEPATALTSSIDTNDLTFTVSDSTVVNKGLNQIEDEMVWVSSVDRTTNTVTLEPWGRGQSGTTAASHSSGVRFTASPKYPRGRLKNLVSQVVQEIFPSLYAVDDVLLTYNTAQYNYALPADCYHVLNVEYQPTGPSQSWIPVKRWTQHKPPGAVMTVEIFSHVQVGTDRVRVFYIKTPPADLTMTDDLESLGFPIAIRDVVVLGVCARLAVFTETSRVQTTAVESAARAEAVPTGSATSLSRYLYQLFRQRLEDEARNLQLRYPIVLHFTR